MSGLADPHDEPYDDEYWVPPEEAPRAYGLPPLAGPGFRWLARLIDNVIVYGVLFAVGLAIYFAYAVAAGSSPDEIDEDARNIASAVVGACGLFMYEWFFLSLWSATPGKLILRMRVRRAADDEPLSPSQAAGRAAAYAGLGLVCCVSLLDVMWCLWDKPLSQCLHDKIARTVVIRVPRPGAPPEIDRFRGAEVPRGVSPWA